VLSANVLQPVCPVVDYEPPAFGAPPELPPATGLRYRPTAPATAPDTSGAHRRPPSDAALFADAALRRVLEVIDRRRSLAQLRPLMANGLVDSLLSAAGRGGSGDPARLRRVRAQTVRSDGTAAEIAASFSRGDRVHAIACRVEQVMTATGPRWQVVALHLG